MKRKQSRRELKIAIYAGIVYYTIFGFMLVASVYDIYFRPSVKVCIENVAVVPMGLSMFNFLSLCMGMMIYHSWVELKKLDSAL